MKFISLFLLFFIFYGCDSFDIERIKHSRDNELDPNKVSGVVAVPIIFPEGKLYTNSVSVTILCSTPGATIYWTTNNGISWTAGSNFIISRSCTLKAKAKKIGMLDSQEKIENYQMVYNFSRTYGGNYQDVGEFIKKTLDGGYIIAGNTESFGNSDIWILKLGSDFNIEWEKAYGGNNVDGIGFESGIIKAECISQTTYGSYVVAGYTKSFGAQYTDILILKLKSDGTIEWQKRYGGNSYDHAYSIQQTSDGGYIVAGYTSSFGANGSVLVLKLNSDGTTNWQKIYGGTSYDGAYSI